MVKNSDLNSIIFDLRNTVMIASQNFDIWWNLKVDKNRKEYDDVINSYLGYFDVAIHAHFVAVIFALYRLMETRTDTHNFFELLKSIQHMPRLKAKFIPTVKQKLADMKPTWIKISILRNDLFGHSNKEKVSTAFARAKVTPKHLRDFIQDAKDLLNLISRRTIRSTHAFNLSSEEVTLELLNDLKCFKARYNN